MADVHPRPVHLPTRLLTRFRALTLLGLLPILFLTSGCLVTNLKKESDFVALEQRVDRLAANNAEALARLEKEMKELKEMLGPRKPAAAPGPAAPLPAGSLPAAQVPGLYHQAMAQLNRRQYEAAAAAFTRIAEGAPRHPLAPNARYWLGECHYSQGRFQQAVAEFEKVVADYPGSNKAPDALLKVAYSYSRLNQGPTAMASLKRLLDRYPGSNAAAMVRGGRTVFKYP